MNTGMGSTFRRGDVWWVSYYYRGERYRESSKSKLKKDAKSLLANRIAETKTGTFIGPRQDAVTFEDLAELIETDYEVKGLKSTRRLRSSLKNLRRYLGRLRAVDINHAKINRYIRDRQTEGAASATIKAETSALRRMFTLAVDGEMIGRAPKVPHPNVNNVRTNFLSMDDVAQVVMRLPEHLKPVVQFAAMTGWRKAEVLGLRWSEVDFEAGVVRLLPGATKNGNGREFPFGTFPPLEMLIGARLELTRKLERQTNEIVPWVFHRNGKQIKSMRGAWNNACELAGLGRTWFHDLRRTAVRNLERAGVSRSVAMSFTGHETESIYKRYAIVDKKGQKEGAAKLAILYAGDTDGRTVVPISEAKPA